MPAAGAITNITDIIDNEMIVTHFQPLVSIKKKSIIGFEALSRGRCPDGTTLIPPQTLFRQADESGQSIALDRLCRKKAVENFKPLYDLEHDFIISVNIDPSIFNTEVVGSNNLLDLVSSLNVHPGRVLIEIIESKIGNIDSLVQFVNTYRSRGFLLALDDIGTGMSNLDRVSLIKPDILKIDKSLIKSSVKEYHSREIIKSLVNLAHTTGSLVIAEGVETEAEALTALELGVDMLQGYYFLKPGEDLIDDIPSINEKIDDIALKFKKMTVEKINAKKKLHKKYNQIINDLTCELSKVGMELFDPTLKNLVKSYPELECVYILDDNGIQVSSTVFAPDKSGIGQGFFFQPGHQGTDQSTKDYFFLIAAGLPKFTTAPYISLASRNVCITISVAFREIDYRKCVLCMDIIQDDMTLMRNNGQS